jgi:hypothetical protein
MMMKKNLLLLGIVAGSLCYQACYEDKGHYDYVPVNKVTITMPAYTMNAYLGETFRCTPTITFANPADTTGFEYWWEYTGNMGLHPRREEICRGKELQFMPSLVGSQNVQLCVREIRSDVITISSLSLNVGSRYARGWLILREEGGESKLSFILPDRSVPGDNTTERVYVPYLDLYGELFPGESLGRDPVALRQAFSQRGIQTIFYVLQGDESVCLNGASYQKEVLLSQEFIGGPPAGLAPRDYYQGNYANMLLNADGTVYYRCPYYGANTDFFTYSFANFPMEHQGRVLKIDRIIHMAEYTYFFAVYDRENNRFWWIYSGYARTGGSLLPAEITAEGEYLDFNDLSGKEILYSAFHNELLSGSTPFADNITLYSKEGKVYVQRCKGSTGQNLTILTGIPVTDVIHRAFPNPEYLAASTCYYQLKTRTYLFFATGNQLYWYDHLSNVVHAFYTFPAGEEVLKMATNPQESELGVLLKSGKFLTLDIVNEHLMEPGNKLYEITIPGDRVVDMEYKFPTIGAYRTLSRTSASNWD